MKKIFYILASAIVALGAVACQNEVDENITPGTQNDVVSFTVSFDDNTRIALGTVENGEASFVFEGNETLYLKYDGDVYEFHNTTDAPNTFTGEGDGLSDIVSEQHVRISNKKNLEDCSNKHNTFNDAAYFRFDGTIGNGSVNLTLSNHVLHCTTGSEPVRLYCNHYIGYSGEEAPEYLDLEANNEYWIDLDNSKINEIAISYDIDGVKVKSTTLNGNTFKIFNLGTLIPAVASVNGTQYTDLAKAVAAATNGTVTLTGDVKLTSPLTIASGSNTTIDMGNNSITYECAVAGETLFMNNNGNLTLENGTVDFTYNGEADSEYRKGNYTIANRGTLTLGKGAIVKNSSEVEKHACYAIDNYAGSTLNITEDAQVINNNNYAIRVFAGNTASNVNISGGHVYGKRAIWIQLPGSDTSVAPEVNVNITGGKLESYGESEEYKLAIYSYNYGNNPKNVKINIEGGELIGDLALTGGANKTDAETVTVTGGTLTDVYSYATDEVATKTISIKGGTFCNAPAENNYPVYVAEGYLALKNYNNANDYYDVVAEDNIVLSTEAQLFWLAEQVAAGNTFDGLTVKLGANIAMTKAWTPIGNKTDGVAYSFRGNFDGQGNTISKLNVTAEEGAGFFGFKWDGDITNVKFDNATIKGNHYAGVVVGWGDGANYNYYWTISGCEVTNSKVTLTVKNKDNGDKAGAIIGYAYGMNVDKCSVSNTTIKGYRDMGALVGMLQSNKGSECATLTNSTVGDKVTVEVDNTENYEYYGTRTEYNVNNFAGRLATGCVVGEGNKGTATIKFPTLGTGTGWGICGTMNNWGGNGKDIEMFIENTAGNVVVARNVYLDSNTAFQFRVDNDWDIQLGAWSEGFSMSAFNNGAWYGSEDGKKANIKVTDITAGNYDIFFATDSYDFYIVSSDSDPRYDL